MSRKEVKINIAALNQLNKPITKNDAVVKKRRHSLPEYQELFQALFKISDKELISRVLKAINNENTACQNCGRLLLKNELATNILTPNIIYDNTKAKSILVDNGTQVNPERAHCWTMTTSRDFQFLEKINNDEFKRNSVQNKLNGGSPPPSLSRPPGRPRRRNNIPFASKSEDGPNKFKEEPDEMHPTELPNDMGFPNIDIPTLPDYEGIQDVPQLPEPKGLKDRMESELHKVLKHVENDKDMLPIHQAASNNDINSLKLQHFILTFLKVDLNIQSEILKNTPLHYAILKDEINDCVEYLLEHCNEIMTKNEKGDNVLHFAAKSIKNLELWQRLLEKVNILEQLNEKNLNGETPLHLVITNNNYPFAKAIIDHVNKQLSIVSIPGITDDMSDEKLIQGYFNFISKDIQKWYRQFPPNPLKIEIINQIDQKTHRTPIFCAINSRNTLMSLFLFANLADPNIPDLSERNCYLLANELILDRKIHLATLEMAYYYKSLETNKTVTKRKSKDIFSYFEKKLKESNF